MKRIILAGGFGLTLTWLTGGAVAQQPWWEVPDSASSSRTAIPRSPIPGPSSVASAVTLGRPQPLVQESYPIPIASLDAPVRQVGYNDALAQPSAPAAIIRAQASEVPVPTAPAPIGPPPAGPAYPIVQPDRYNSGVVMEPPPGSPPPSKGMFDWVNPGASSGHSDRKMFESDHCFDVFASPVTNPFYFEDPRALTEVRPIFIWQKVPSDNYLYGGGNVFWYGTQLRLAFTDWFSIVMPKLGGITNDPSRNDPFRDLTAASGFSELWIGPKFTFFRSDASNTVIAGGLTFEIPIGSESVFQHTGDLSLTPYFSLAQNFWKTSYGSMNFMTTPAYSFRVDNKRTSFFNLSMHLDYDVANLHKIYPFVEMNWTNYNPAGKLTYFGFEGRDLFNFGSHGVSGNNELTLAFGGRFKLSEVFQFGIGAEFPIVGGTTLEQFRLTADVIVRY